MKKNNLLHAFRCLLFAVVLTTFTAVAVMAGDIPITPAPCDPTTQQCTASTSGSESSGKEAEDTGTAPQDLTVDAVLILVPFVGPVLLSVIS